MIRKGVTLLSEIQEKAHRGDREAA